MTKTTEAARAVLHRAVDIRTGEITKTVLISLFFFLVIFALTVVKPVRNSLFLSELGAAQLPYMYLATAAFTGVLVLIDSKLSTILNRAAFMTATLGFLLLNLVAFWWLVKLPENWVTPTFYIWISFFNYVLIAHFWTFTNDFFNARDAKRLYGFVLTVGTIGGILGGLAADLSVETVFSTEDVLLLAAAALLLSIGLVYAIEHHAPSRTRVDDHLAASVRKLDVSGRTPDRRFNRRHIVLLGLMIVFGVIISTIIDYQFNWVVQEKYPTKMARTEFFGEFFALLNAISLVMQFFLTGQILKKYGIGLALLLMPLILAAGAIGFMLMPAIALASFLKISDKTLSYSLMQSSRELLFLPIPSEIRVKTKLLLDVFVNRFASGVAAGLILLFTLVFPLSISQLSLVALGFLVVWIVIIIALRKEYINSIKGLLVRRNVDIGERVISTLDAETVQTLKVSLHSSDSTEILYALSLLELLPTAEIKAELTSLLKHSEAKIRAQALRLLFTGGDSEMVSDLMPLLSDDDIEVRSEAIHFVWEYCQTCPDDRISEFLSDPDPKVKGAMLVSMINHTGELAENGATVLNEMLHNKSKNGEAHRIEAAKVLGVAASGFGLHSHLRTLMEDPALKVRLAAIESAGKVLHDEFVAPLIAKMADAGVKKAVRVALANYGNRVLPVLEEKLADPGTDLRIRKNIPHVLRSIETQECWESLVENMEHTNTAIRHEVVKSLNKILESSPGWQVGRERIQTALVKEVRDYYWKLSIFYVYARKQQLRIDVREVDDILYVALQEKLAENLDRIFRTIGLIYPKNDVQNLYYFFVEGNADERANALEYLDNLLPNDLMVLLLPILDDIPLKHRVRQGRALFDLQPLTREEALAELLNDSDLWLQACAIYSLSRERIGGFEAQVELRLQAKERLLNESARKYFRVLASPANAPANDRLESTAEEE